jgi:predicted permease
VLVVCQIAASLVLALIAGQFIRSLLNYQGLDAGFRPDHLITVSVRPDLVKYNPQRRIAYERQMDARLSELPGVKAVTFSADAFGKSTWNTLVHVPGYTPRGTLDDTLNRNLAGPRLVETLGLQLLAGRDFDQRDNVQAPPTVIVNESFARHFFGTEDVLGRQIFFIDSPKRADTIVGIVRDARDRGLRQPTKPAVYSNYEHDALGWMTFTVRVERPATAMLKEIVSAFQQFDSQVPIERTGTAEAAMDESLARERTLADLSSLIGLLATGIAMVGLYGTLAYRVVRRTREIGIRMALGARTSQVQWLAIRDGALLLLAGIALGMPVYAAVARLFRDLVFGVEPGDPLVAIGVLALLGISAGMATYIPSWRAARVDPARALKYD